MSQACSQDCSSCPSSCSKRNEELWEKPHELSSIKKVIAVMSGKGGVGKSMVTSLLAVSLQRAGLKVGVLDADITGPSIPRAFGLREKAVGDELGIYPVRSGTGIPVMSVNLLLPNETDPVVWRGPVIAGTVKQFWTEVIWGELDCLLIDLPPGTGDVPLTVFQSIPVSGAVVVTSPQDMVSMIVGKAVQMARLMNIPILGVVENYSYFQCPDCGKKHAIFGESHVEQVAADLGLSLLAKLPIDPALAAACDAGKVEEYQPNPMADVAKKLDALL
ncbi:Iron-sulfur cluster carrier protein [bioreactor metagenome]|uniref:Iron-sulfur cluster carrier protein n=1 Tax=bioreactor metagenome TaxID=1076179 RepID=A0A644ZDQ2_9ZZZZ